MPWAFAECTGSTEFTSRTHCNLRSSQQKPHFRSTWADWVESCHRRSTRRAPFHWLDRGLSAQPTGDFRWMLSNMTLPSARLGRIEICIQELLQQSCDHLTQLSEPSRCVYFFIWSNILFWKSSETRDWNTRSIFKKLWFEPRPKPPITPIKRFINAPSTTALANVAQHLQNACLQQSALFRGVCTK